MLFPSPPTRPSLPCLRRAVLSVTPRKLCPSVFLPSGVSSSWTRGLVMTAVLAGGMSAAWHQQRLRKHLNDRVSLPPLGLSPALQRGGARPPCSRDPRNKGHSNLREE